MIQYRQTSVVIDLNAIRHNARETLSKTNPHQMHLMAIVKADAYGHGASVIAKTLQGAGVQHLAVATIEEGIQLREAGIKASITVLGGLFGDSGKIFSEYRLFPVIHQMPDLIRLGNYLKQIDRPLTVHIKIDTGMGRLGFLPTETTAAIDFLRGHSQIKVEGVMTHLARADEPDPKPTEEQFFLFQHLTGHFSPMGIKVFHIANSAAIIEGRLNGFQLARPGIMLYGAYPHPRHRELINLKPAMTFRTKILGIKKYPIGACLSYGGTFVTQRESLIATLPVGYADGYPRLVSNRGYVLVRGQKAPVVGRVCMDLTLVDVTDIIDATLEDDVLLFGQSGDHYLPVEEVATWAETISYEILCGISKRVPRIYEGM